MEKNHNVTGMTLSCPFSEATHWTMKRIEKKAWPRNPIANQNCSALNVFAFQLLDSRPLSAQVPMLGSPPVRTNHP